jgi:hypothetical protein
MSSHEICASEGADTSFQGCVIGLNGAIAAGASGALSIGCNAAMTDSMTDSTDGSGTPSRGACGADAAEIASAVPAAINIPPTTVVTTRRA